MKKSLRDEGLIEHYKKKGKSIRGEGLIKQYIKNGKQLKGEGLIAEINKKQYKKELRNRYHGIEAIQGETFTDFKKRMKQKDQKDQKLLNSTDLSIVR